MDEFRLECRGGSFTVTVVRREDWEWIKDTLEESFMRSVPPLYADVDRRTVRERAIMEAGKLRDNKDIPNEIFVARTGDGERAGVLWVAVLPHQYTGEKSGFVLEIFVSPGFRRKGLAKALIEVGEEWTRSQGLDKIGLAVGACNEAAIGLYRSLGFQVDGCTMGKQL